MQHLQQQTATATASGNKNSQSPDDPVTIYWQRQGLIFIEQKKTILGTLPRPETLSPSRRMRPKKIGSIFKWWLHY